MSFEDGRFGSPCLNDGVCINNNFPLTLNDTLLPLTHYCQCVGDYVGVVLLDEDDLVMMTNVTSLDEAGGGGGSFWMDFKCEFGLSFFYYHFIFFG